MNTGTQHTDTHHTVESLDCEVCGRPGQPSWGGVVLCESCYGTVGATCSGLPRTKAAPPSQTGTEEPSGAPGPVC